jgi:diguanylate cyclase (GGDEF)-like protein
MTIPPTTPQTSLSQQAGRRFAGIILIIGGMSAILFALAWHFAYDTLNREQVDRNAAAIQAKLDSRYGEWQRQAEALATHIDYAHLLVDSGTQRWAALNTYLNVLGDSLPFDTLAITDSQGHVIFSKGVESGELETLAAKPSQVWHFSPIHRHLHRVLRAPLNLDGRHGQLLLLQTIDNPRLADLAMPDLELTLSVDDVVYASSVGGDSLFQRLPRNTAPLHLGPNGELCRDLVLGDANTRIHIRQNLPQAVSPAQFALAGIGLTAALALSLYSVFGEWLRRAGARVRALSSAAELFARRHRLDADTNQALDKAAGEPDEIGTLLRQLRALMRAGIDRDEESHAYLQTLDLLEEAVVEVDWQGKLLRASPAWSTLMGPDNSARNLYEHFTLEDREDLQRQLAKVFSREKNQVSLRLRAHSPQRSGAWLECRFVPVLKGDAGGSIDQVRGVLRDITQTYLQEKHITHMALHDALTGLPNRVLLEDRIQVALRMALREHSRVGIGFIDIDHFKNINDALGHKAGDQLLVAFANKLREGLRTVDTLARWGGDEFVILLPDMPGIDEIRHVAEKLAHASRDPVRIDGHALPVTFSMGFTIYPDDGDEVGALLSQADRAMFHAKAQGRNMVQFYNDMAKKGLGRKELYIQSRLAAAISEGHIETWFQPVVDARSRKVVGIEALARWRDPELGWVSPTTFIPMAENLGLIPDLGSRMMTQTLAVGRQLLDAGHNFMLGINISKRQLFMSDCIEQLLRASASAGIPPGRIMLEITESVAMSEVEYAENRLRALHDAGFKLAVDDFGVGYSSLSQLHEMPVDELKIDLSFIQRAREPQGAQLIQAIVGMAQALHLHIVAEGVEDAETAAVLEQMGIQSFQGFHFGKPMPAAEFAGWLQSREQDPASSGGSVVAAA